MFKKLCLTSICWYCKLSSFLIFCWYKLYFNTIQNVWYSQWNVKFCLNVFQYLRWISWIFKQSYNIIPITDKAIFSIFLLSTHFFASGRIPRERDTNRRDDDGREEQNYRKTLFFIAFYRVQYIDNNNIFLLLLTFLLDWGGKHSVVIFVARFHLHLDSLLSSHCSGANRK